MRRRDALEDLRIALAQNAGLIGAVAIFVVLYLFYHASHPRGFSTAVLIQNSNETFALAMVAVAQTLPVLLGGLDLSVGAVMTLVNCLASVVLNGTPAEMALGAAACLATGAVCGFLNGCLVVYGRLQPIIATLATGAIFLGLALTLLFWGPISDLFGWARGRRDAVARPAE